MAGVDIPEKGDAWAVGYFATALRRVKGRWRAAEDLPFEAAQPMKGPVRVPGSTMAEIEATVKEATLW